MENLMKKATFKFGTMEFKVIESHEKCIKMAFFFIFSFSLYTRFKTSVLKKGL